RARHRRHPPGDEARVPGRAPVVGPGREVPLLPLLPGLRSRLRLALLRPRLPPGHPALPRDADGRRAVAVRPEAEGHGWGAAETTGARAGSGEDPGTGDEDQGRPE